jgi:hypothetical protein
MIFITYTALPYSQRKSGSSGTRFHGHEEWEPPRRQGRQGRNAKAGINFLLPGNGKRKTALTKTSTRFWSKKKLCAFSLTFMMF